MLRWSRSRVPAWYPSPVLRRSFHSEKFCGCMLDEPLVARHSRILTDSTCRNEVQQVKPEHQAPDAGDKHSDSDVYDHTDSDRLTSRLMEEPQRRTSLNVTG